MNKNKFTLETDRFGGIVNFKTNLLYVSRPRPGVKTKELNVVRVADQYSSLFVEHALKGTTIPKMLIRAEWNEMEQYAGRSSLQSHGGTRRALLSLRNVFMYMQIKDNQEHINLVFESTVF